MYSILFSILKDAKINKMNDLSKLNKKDDSRLFIDSLDYPWVKDIYYVVLKNYESVVRNYMQFEKKLFVGNIDSPSSDFTNYNIGIRTKYSCIFPRRIMYFSRRFVLWADKLIMIPLEFFQLLFLLKPVLLNGLAYLLPRRLTGKEESDVGVWSYSDAKFEYTPDMLGLADISSMSNRKNFEGLTLNLKWLNGARLDDYVDLAITHQEEYSLLLYALDRKIDVNTTPNDIVDWIEFVDHSIQKLNLAFERRQKELMTKGIETSIGLLVSLGVLLYPQVSELKTVITTVCSSKTLLDGVSCILALTNLHNEYNDNDFWVIWRATQ